VTESAPGRSDAELVASLAAGDEGALGDLYDRHADSVFRVAYRLLGDRGQAEDVLQETILALWNRAETYDPRVASLAAWLTTIARNRAVDRLRARARRPFAVPLSATFEAAGEDEGAAERVLDRGILVGGATPQHDPELVSERRETRDAVRNALSRMPPLERQALELAYYGELSQSEIALRLDWPLGTVKTRTRRALLRLRGLLGEELGGEWQAHLEAPLDVRVTDLPAQPGLPPAATGSTAGLDRTAASGAVPEEPDGSR